MRTDKSTWPYGADPEVAFRLLYPIIILVLLYYREWELLRRLL